MGSKAAAVLPVTSLRISSRVNPTASWAATLAIGNPVALEARAEERDTRGFISITTRRPVRGSTANWTLAPPVSTPTARSTVRASSRIAWYSRSDRVIWGATVTESPVWTPIGSKFSIEQTTTALSARSRITSSSNSFQPSTDSSIRTRPTGLAVRPSASSRSSSPGVRAMPPPQPPRVNEGRMTTGRPRSSATARPSATVPTSTPRGRSSPAARQVSANTTRDSALRTASTVAPISSTPSRSRVPFSCRATARLRAVCPPRVGSRASGRSASSTAATGPGVSGSR